MLDDSWPSAPLLADSPAIGYCGSRKAEWCLRLTGGGARACSGGLRGTCPAPSPTWECCEMDGLEGHVTGFFVSHLPNARGVCPSSMPSTMRVA